MKNHEKKAVLVMGMHRSGTSVLSAGLEAIGVSLGRKTDWVSDENPKGFFENKDITPFNDRLLKFFGASWDNPFFDCRNAIREKQYHLLKPWYDEAAGLLQNNFSDKSVWSIKDPRMCLLLPFWQKAFSDFGYDPDNTFYVFIVRNPVEVSLSQQTRQKANPGEFFIGKDLRQTLLLWFSHYFRSFLELNSNNNIFLTYKNLINNTELELNRISNLLNIDCQKSVLDNKIKEFSCSFIDKKLYRSKQEPTNGEAVLNKQHLIGEMYSFLLELSKEEIVSSERLKTFNKKQKDAFELFGLISSFSEAISGSWYQYQDAKKEKERIAAEKERIAAEKERLLERFVAEKERLVDEKERLVAEKDIVERELNETRNTIEEILHSQSWRTITFFRRTFGSLPGGRFLTKIIKKVIFWVSSR